MRIPLHPLTLNAICLCINSLSPLAIGVCPKGRWSKQSIKGDRILLGHSFFGNMPGDRQARYLLNIPSPLNSSIVAISLPMPSTHFCVNFAVKSLTIAEVASNLKDKESKKLFAQS